MNSSLNDPRPAWTRLTAAARTVRDTRDSSAPFGFATRVAALAMGQDRRVASLFDLFALRALGIACVLAACSVALNYNEIAARWGGSAGEDMLLAGNDAVAVVLALAD